MEPNDSIYCSSILSKVCIHFCISHEKIGFFQFYLATVLALIDNKVEKGKLAKHGFTGETKRNKQEETMRLL